MNLPLLTFVWLSNSDLENINLLWAALVILIIAGALCRFFRLLLECKLSRRKVRFRSLAHRQRNVRLQTPAIIKRQPHPFTVKALPKTTSRALSYKTRHPVDALEALRRSCAANNNPSKKNAPKQ